MATFSEIQTRVTRRVIDAPVAITAEVPALIVAAVRSLQNAHNFKVMEAKTSSLTTTDGSHALSAVPSDFKEYRGKPYVLRDDGTVKRLLVAPDEKEAFRMYSPTATDDTGEPVVLVDPEPSSEAGARTWDVYPLPDGGADWDDGEYRVVVPYWKYLADLSDDADTNWFTVNAEEYLVAKATSEAFFLNWDAEKGAYWEQKAAIWRREAIDIDKMLRFSQVETLVPYQGVNDPKLEA